jgi:hypothetical protein
VPVVNSPENDLFDKELELSFKEKLWQDLKCGDIVLLKEDE